MIDVFHLSSLSWRHDRLALSPHRAFEKAAVVQDATRTVEDLPDAILREMGVRRNEIPFVADAIASRHGCIPRRGCDRFFWRKTARAVFCHVLAAMKALSGLVTRERPRIAQQAQFNAGRATTGATW